MDFFISNIKAIIGLFGIIVAIWQHKQKANLEKSLRANNWFNFQRTNNVTGNIQLSLTLYKERYKENIDIDLLETLSKADAFGQEIYKESVRLLHFSESSFTHEDIEAWHKDGKITDGALPLFHQLTTSKKHWYSFFLTFFKK